MSARAGGGAAYALPPLPYPESALAPVISGRTLRYHHGKHHAGYIDKLNGLIAGDRLQGTPLDELIRQLAGKPERADLFEQAAQAWNHAFLWNCLAPGGGRPSGALRERLQADFGGYDQFVERFAHAALNRFGSGWAWLVFRGGHLEVETTPNAETPAAHGSPCILTLDLWEHAYYLDYQNRREAHVRAVVAERLNWQFAAQNFARAGGG